MEDCGFASGALYTAVAKNGRGAGRADIIIRIVDEGRPVLSCSHDIVAGMI